MPAAAAAFFRQVNELNGATGFSISCEHSAKTEGKNTTSDKIV
jgi:hypothetical protein